MDLNIHQGALKEVTNLFDKKKLMNVAELTATYSQKELIKMEEACIKSLQTIEIAGMQGVLQKHFPNPIELMSFVSFISTQGQMLERAILYNEGIHLMNMTTLEGVETLKIYNN
jgi:hypothetical protein